ncbi:MAG: disulfide bond formation protein B [Zhengella sp.]|uniref:disulfide bond formation protein B n=1 Tax=Hyphomicrobiales TaxID=356 RepID=UPI0012EBBD59|nr:disulfide bond formation protein B [Salaquimonas pukyongi]MCB9994791.1 disulfide bond formation protein B [Hyphomicrobiaceae bacterium]MCO5134220.1 disulfide bond formation protein B [Phyllobacteriaceae bacterium]HPR05464.1 disulfide bond formation protein B [Denitromonas sp.]HRW61415.1 disulfide bond formation protein B [Defluviicoccus sp.]
MTDPESQRLNRDELLITVAFLIAMAATLGALFIGEVLGQMPCTLCWYQRIAMFPLVPILGLSLWRGDGMARPYSLTLTLAGMALAIWHSGLYAGWIPQSVAPCTRDGPSCTDQAQAILSIPIPYLSLIAFSAILICLILPKGNRL